MTTSNGLVVAVVVAVATFSGEQAADAWSAQTELEKNATAREKFALFNHCRPMRLSVEYPSHPALQQELQREFEGKLDSVSIHDPTHSTHAALVILVGVSEGSMAYTIEYSKSLVGAFGESGEAITWHRVMFGSHEDTGSGIARGARRIVDEFVSDYLRVNESACLGRHQAYPPIREDSAPDAIAWKMIRLENTAPAEWRHYWMKGIEFELAHQALRLKAPFELAEYRSRAVRQSPLDLHRFARRLWAGLAFRPDGEPCAIADGPCR